MQSGLIERLGLNQSERRRAAACGLQRPSRPLAFHIPRHLPIAHSRLIPKVRRARRDDLTIFQMTSWRQIGILETTILNQLRVQTAFARVANLFKEDTV